MRTFKSSGFILIIQNRVTQQNHLDKLQVQFMSKTLKQKQVQLICWLVLCGRKPRWFCLTHSTRKG